MKIGSKPQQCQNLWLSSPGITDIHVTPQSIVYVYNYLEIMVIIKTHF